MKTSLFQPVFCTIGSRMAQRAWVSSKDRPAARPQGYPRGLRETRLRLLLAGALSLSWVEPAVGQHASVFPAILVSEREPVLEVALNRYFPFDTKPEHTVEFYTVDGHHPSDPVAALAGRDYLATNGVRLIGHSPIIAIPILDNGLLNPGRHFSLVIRNRSTLESIRRLIRIEDNEASPLGDPTFVPEVFPQVDCCGDPTRPAILPLADRGILLAGARRLSLDGAVDFGFHFAPRSGFPLAAHSDGSAWVWVSPVEQGFLGGLYRVSSRGEVIQKIRISDHQTTCVAGPDGSLYLRRPGVIVERLNRDGVRDPAFKPVTLSPPGDRETLSFPDDGKLLVWGGLFDRVNGEEYRYLVRLHHNGSVDEEFQPTFDVASINSVLALPGGKVLLSGGFQFGPDLVDGVIRLNSDGTLDPGFVNQLGEFSEQENRYPYPKLVAVNGQVMMVEESNLRATLSRLNDDGSLDASFRLDLNMWPVSGQQGRIPLIATGTSNGEVLVVGGIGNVPGTSEIGVGLRFLRFRLNAKPDFRPIPSAWFHRSPGEARLKIVRTGDTMQTASVRVSTRDGSARAGVDYVARTETVTFAPLEVDQEIAIALIAPGEQPLKEFLVELAEPSAGYEVNSPVTLRIASGPQIVPESARLEYEESSGQWYFSYALRGATWGSHYLSEISSDLKRWESSVDSQAYSDSVVWFSPYVTDLEKQFFRVREEEP